MLLEGNISGASVETMDCSSQSPHGYRRLVVRYGKVPVLD